MLITREAADSLLARTLILHRCPTSFFSERIQTYFKEVTLANVVEWIAPAPTSPDFQKRRPPRVARSYGVSSPGACDAPPGTQLIVRFGILASS